MSADYSMYTAFISDQQSTEYRAWTAGTLFLLLTSSFRTNG